MILIGVESTPLLVNTVNVRENLSIYVLIIE
jgi:hypothetical protein